jgi:hypothetical protein
VALFLDDLTGLDGALYLGDSVFLLFEIAYCGSFGSSGVVWTLIISTFDLSELALSKTDGGAASSVG